MKRDDAGAFISLLEHGALPHLQPQPNTSVDEALRNFCRQKIEHSEYPICIRSNDDGSKAVLFLPDGTTQYYDVKKRCSYSFPKHAAIRSLSFTPDGVSAVGGLSDGSVIVWNFNDSEKIESVNYHASLGQLEL